MARNFVQQGDVIAVTATAAVKSGDGYLCGSLFGVAAVDAASAMALSLQVEGVSA
jgi:predicted RecA/RadA family phage recombinase